MIKKMPKVSFISVFHNRSQFVDESVGSMLSQTYINIEYILWDDCSTDNTYQKLLEFASDNVRVIRSERNQGFTKSLIKAIDISNGSLIALHGSGDISKAERIEKQVESLLFNHYDIVGCLTLRSSEALQKSLASKASVRDFSDPRNPLVTHGEVLYTREIYERAGGYRDFFRMSQDFDLWLRMRDLDASFGHVPEILYETVSRKAGVSGNYCSRYIQGHYAALAYQCWRERQKNTLDVVDQHGVNAWAFLKPCKFLAFRINQSIRLAIQAEDYLFALKAALKSIKCAITIKCVCALTIILIDKNILRKPLLKTAIFGKTR